VRCVIEIVIFRLRPDVADEDFLAIDGRIQTDVAYQCDGLLRRTLARDGDRWLVLQIWATPTACLEGARVLETSALGREFMALVDRSTLRIDRFGEPDRSAD
jgi:hypothetical protein